MEDEYDVIVLGTGLKECILSGLLSVNKKKVLHMDRNDYYGANEASLNLKQLVDKVKPEEKLDLESCGPTKQYSIDLCPKFIMSNGNMVKMLLSTKVTRYLDFKCIDGSFVLNSKHGSKPIEVPVTPKKAVTSSLLNLMQKRRYRNFLQWVMQADASDKKTWADLDLSVDKQTRKCKQTPKQLFDFWKLSDTTIEFSGHSVALYTTDVYMDDARETWPFVSRMKLYAHSLARYEKSPYIYPIWGLGGLPEGFSRLAAVHGGVYMLRRPVKSINYDEDGKVVSVTTESDGTAKLKKGGKLLADASYFLDTLGKKDAKIKKRRHGIARWIFICKQEHLDAANLIAKKPSGQIIITGAKAKRAHDIYISVLSHDQKIAPKGYAVITISSKVEKQTEKEQKLELDIAKKLVPDKYLQDFFIYTDCYVACNDPRKDNIFITETMDATTHFQAATREVMTIYQLMTGQAVDLSAKAEDIDKDE